MEGQTDRPYFIGPFQPWPGVQKSWVLHQKKLHTLSTIYFPIPETKTIILVKMAFFRRLPKSSLMKKLTDVSLILTDV